MHGVASDKSVAKGTTMFILGAKEIGSESSLKVR
jgi:hypothetical protein